MVPEHGPSALNGGDGGSGQTARLRRNISQTKGIRPHLPGLRQGSGAPNG